MSSSELTSLNFSNRCSPVDIWRTDQSKLERLIRKTMKGSDEEIVVIPPANERKRSRAQPVEFPTDCILTITVHIITVNPTLQYIKSQRSTSYTVEYASSILNNIDNDDPSNNASHPTITASELQKIIVNFFASRAT